MILSIHKKLRVLKKFESADGLSIRPKICVIPLHQIFILTCYCLFQFQCLVLMTTDHRLILVWVSKENLVLGTFLRHFSIVLFFYKLCSKAKQLRSVLEKFQIQILWS